MAINNSHLRVSDGVSYLPKCATINIKSENPYTKNEPIKMS